MERKQELLHKYFGYATFRNGQEALIDAQLSGNDVFGIMPTGGGKSLCYQLPALMMDGVTLVISPLISLMQDQVMALKNNGIAAAYINRSLRLKQIHLVYRNMSFGQYKIIYIAPERLLTDGFLQAVSRIKVAMVVIDEAHCISQWGQDFRPGYLRISDFLKLLPNRPVVSAFTSTATAEVREDVVRLLGLRNPHIVITGFDRPNLHFEVRKAKDKAAALCSLIEERKSECGMIYCATRKDVDRTCALLREKGLLATRYHAGLTDEERCNNQDDFLNDRCKIMVATNAFGMGINKSNVRFVIHYSMPQSIEAYYQEAGRAGRDGAPAECILLYAAADIRTAIFFIQHPRKNEMLSDTEQQVIMERDVTRLKKMLFYCNTEQCLRGYILDYFGQAHQTVCGNCSSCDANIRLKDSMAPVRIILLYMRKIHKKMDYYMGLTMIKERKILNFGAIF